MFATQFAGAIACAQFSDLTDLSHKLWRAHAAGHLDDAQAQGLAEILDRKKGGYRDIGPPSNFAPAASPRARRQRSSDKIASIERRRRLARASPVPPELVDQFTQGEHAVITVVAGEIARAGACTWCLDRIAAISGVCKTLVRNAMRKARAVGLLFSIERRRRGQKSLTNIVRVLCRSWGAWLRRRGCIFLRTTTDKVLKNGTSSAVQRSQSGLSMMTIARTVPP
jgi:hypothetical protein